MARLYWIITAIIFGMIAWRELSHRLDIEEIRSELREMRREQRDGSDYLLQMLREQGSKYDVLVQITTKDRSECQNRDKSVKEVIRKLLDIIDELWLNISKIENHHRDTESIQKAKIDQLKKEIRDQKAELQVTTSIQEAKIDQLENEIRDQKAELQEYKKAVASMEDKLRRECRTDVARLEEKVNEKYQTVNETLHDVVEFFISEMEQSRRECKNDTIALAEEVRQIQINVRERITIQNEVIVQSGHHLQESDHHYRNFGAKYGAMVGELVGGYAQDIVTGLWSRAINLLTKLK